MLVRADLSVVVFYFVWTTMAQAMAQDEKDQTNPVNEIISKMKEDFIKKDEPPFVFPKTLEEFEYAFNEQGELRHTKTGKPFVFNEKEEMHRWNQKRYEALGEIITEYVYTLLEKDCGLKKEILPVDAKENEPKSFIYMSEDALTNPNKLLVLIQGSGVVRAGQWARRLIINQDLDSGTQIPFIKRAKEEGYGVMVLNPNENYQEVEKKKKEDEEEEEEDYKAADVNPDEEVPWDASDEPAEKRERKEEEREGGKKKKKKERNEKYGNPQQEGEKERESIRDNSSPVEHTLYVWDQFISKSRAQNVFVVAHSYGGLSFLELAIHREDKVTSRVKAVAMTDSVHNLWHQEADTSVQDWLRENCRNWVSSPEPLDTPVECLFPDCPRVSAGTERHELTSWKSFHSIFKFFNQRLQPKTEERKDQEEELTLEQKEDAQEKEMKKEAEIQDEGKKDEKEEDSRAEDGAPITMKTRTSGRTKHEEF